MYPWQHLGIPFKCAGSVPTEKGTERAPDWVQYVQEVLIKTSSNSHLRWNQKSALLSNSAGGILPDHPLIILWWAMRSSHSIIYIYVYIVSICFYDIYIDPFLESAGLVGHMYMWVRMCLSCVYMCSVVHTCVHACNCLCTHGSKCVHGYEFIYVYELHIFLTIIIHNKFII